MSGRRIYFPSIALTQPELPAHVAEINALQSRLLLAWGRLRGEAKVRAVELVEALGAKP